MGSFEGRYRHCLASAMFAIHAAACAEMPPAELTPSSEATACSQATCRLSALPDDISVVVNVRDCGAVGDGVSDDQPAFMAAGALVSSYLRGGVVYIPAGTYLFKRSYIGDGQSNIEFAGD